MQHAEESDTFTENQSYRLENFLVREFNGTKYLVMPRGDYKLKDIQNIEALEVDDSTAPSYIKNARIVAVLSLENHRICLRCKARVEPCTPPFGRCSQPTCGTSQLYDACAELLTAKLMFMTGQSSMAVTLNASGNVLKEIVEGRSVTERELLSLKEFKVVQYNNMDAITSVTRYEETTV